MEPTTARPGRLVLGLAGTVDYEIAWDATVLEDLVRHHRIRKEELILDRSIDTERDLVATILAFVAEGAGGERYVGSSSIIEELACRFAKRVTLGGTPVRAALAMHAVGIPSHLHLVSIDDHVRRLLPAACTYTCSAQEDSTDPHLIVQYPTGARVHAGDIDVSAHRANRLIFANDPPARSLVLSEDLGAALADAEVFLVSGFNVIQEPDVLDQRLEDLQRHLKSLAPGAVVHYEDAGFHAAGLNLRVHEALRDSVSVHSMNEDEMQAYVGREVDLLDPEQVHSALVDLAGLLPGPSLVVHTTYWALALGSDAAVWTASLRGGVTMATTRYVHGDRFTEDDYRATAELPQHPAGVVMSAALRKRLGDRVCCVPALSVHVAEPTTIGLGDTFVGGFVAALATSRLQS